MTDFDEGLQEWRYRHIKLVERTIGAKQRHRRIARCAVSEGVIVQADLPRSVGDPAPNVRTVISDW